MKPLVMTVKTKASSKNKFKSENLTEKINRAKKIVALLKKNYPDAHCALDHKNAFELLVATILSAQCTDERVNMVTPKLFETFPDAKSMSEADQREIELFIHSTGFYKNKAKNIIACAQKIISAFRGEVPSTMEELTSLAGVGRKTANVILGNIFNVPGLVVDTHVARLSNRLGFARGKDAVKLELELQKIISKKNWTMYSHYLITHGRKICKARTPDCENCFLNKLCPKLPYE